jgi:hypothetical protein
LLFRIYVYIFTLMEQQHNPEQITKECHADLKEIAFWFGGWSELRKVIDQLEENYEQGRAEAAMEPDYDAPSVQETMEKHYKQKYS